MEGWKEEYITSVVTEWIRKTACQAEIGNLDVVLLVDENVLVVSMNGKTLPAA